VALHEVVLTRDVPLRVKRRRVEMRLVIEGASAGIAWSAQKQLLGIG
jgi:hypothetical protein